jgi:cytochrome b6-f complex iron-sulfur subunit
MRRRSFILCSGAGMGAALLPGLAGLRRAAAQAAAASVDVASFEQLKKSGQLLLNKTGFGPVLLVLQGDTRAVTAFDPRCPHRGCTVDWESSSKTFVCPCHGVVFNGSGKVIEGTRTRKPLTSYQAKVVGGRVLISQA